MVLGFSKSFVITLFIAIIMAIGFKNPSAFWQVMIVYAVIKIIWKILT